MINRKQVISLVMGGLLSAALPVSAFAVSPNFARTDEEWARLRDNVIEYDELAGLIHEYNATVQKNQYEFQDYKSKDRDDIEQDYRDLASELLGSMTGGDDAGSMIADLNLSMQARTYDEKADDNIDDSESIYLGYVEAEDKLVVAAQSNMISYFKKLEELSLAYKTVEMEQINYQAAAAQNAAGTVTQIQVLNAQESLLKAQQAVTDLETTVESIRQKLCVMLGWKHDDRPEIRELPMVDFARLDAMNPAVDKAQALENSYTLKINQRKLSNVRTEIKKNELQETIAGNERTIGASVMNAYQAVLAARIAYEQAVAEENLEIQNMRIAEQQMALGTISDLQFKQQQYTMASKQSAKRSAELNLLEAVETYDWNLKGLADAG